MASPTYAVRALVLRKTKLGEGDLIVSLLAEDGSARRVVAKGARKPSSAFSSRLELCSEVDLLCAKGRSLDVVKEARLVDAHATLRGDLERSAAAACMCELLERTVQDELVIERLFPMTSAALTALEEAPAASAAAITAAHLLKTLAFIGFRPSFDRCVGCGAPVSLEAPAMPFSALEGGVVCPACARELQTVRASGPALAFALGLLRARFADLATEGASARANVEVLHLIDALVVAHVGARLKSLRFFLTAGLDLDVPAKR